MKMFIKMSCITALALAMTTLGAVQARAGGWAVAGGVVGGLAVGTAIGASVACAAPPAYYTYAPPVYAAPAYYAPSFAVAAAPAYYCGPRVVYAGPYSYYHPYLRAGYGWGPRYFRGRPFYRR